MWEHATSAVPAHCCPGTEDCSASGEGGRGRAKEEGKTLFCVTLAVMREQNLPFDTRAARKALSHILIFSRCSLLKAAI